MADRDTRYLPFPGEKVSRHSSVEHSIPHVISRVPARVCVNLSPGYHICSVTPSSARDPIGSSSFSACPFLFLSFATPPTFPPSPPTLNRHPIPFESRRCPLSLSRPPRSACDSKPQDTCCIACLLVHPQAAARTRTHACTAGQPRTATLQPF